MIQPWNSEPIVWPVFGLACPCPGSNEFPRDGSSERILTAGDARPHYGTVGHHKLRDDVCEDRDVVPRSSPNGVDIPSSITMTGKSHSNEPCCLRRNWPGTVRSLNTRRLMAGFILTARVSCRPQNTS